MIPTPKIGMLLAPASQTNGATRTANLDTLGSDYAIIKVPISSAINTNAVGPTLVLSESDDTVVTNFATWSSSCTVSARSIVNASQTNFKIDTRTRKRYIRLAITAAGATNDVITNSASYDLYRNSISQPAASNMLASTNDSVVTL